MPRVVVSMRYAETQERFRAKLVRAMGTFETVVCMTFGQKASNSEDPTTRTTVPLAKDGTDSILDVKSKIAVNNLFH